MKLNEDNLSNNLVQGGTSIVLSAYLQTVYMEMLPWLVAAVPLLIGDLYFGVRVMMRRREKVRLLKAVSMTLDKAFSYVCWVLISTTLSVAFSADTIKYVILAFIYFREVVSCFRNYFNARGYDVDERGLFKLIWRKIFNDGEALADEASHLVKKDKEEERNG
jgi:hypothetical protein